MVVRIKDPDAGRPARRLATLTGEFLTATVKAALRARLARKQRRRDNQIDRAKIDAIVASIVALPVVDARSPEELIGYDDLGLPTR
jgi:antitoxin VapB